MEKKVIKKVRFIEDESLNASAEKSHQPLRRLEASGPDLGKKRLRLVHDEDEDDEEYEQIDTKKKRQRVEPEEILSKSMQLS